MAKKTEKQAACKNLAHQTTAAVYSESDKAALDRVRRKLVRLMLLSLTMTFIALAVVIIALIYKAAHTQTGAAPNGNTSVAAQQEQNGGQLVSGNIAANNPIAAESGTIANNTAETPILRQALHLQAGERIENAALSGNLVLLQLSNKTTKESQLLIYNFTEGAVVARIAVSNAAKP